MNLKKWISAALALVLALSAFALAETAGDDLQAQLDAANARIAELEAQVALYQPYYEQQIVAEYGEDGVIWLADAQERYESAAAMYSQYGISVDDYADQIKQSILESLVEGAVLDAKAAEMGLKDLDEDTLATIDAEAAAEFDEYVQNYRGYFTQDGMAEDEIVEQTVNFLESNGLTLDVLKQQHLDSYVNDLLYDAVTADVNVTDEDVQASYQDMLADAEAAYADDYGYNSARSGGETILWNPEGYRAVKHVLIQFSDEQSDLYNDLTSTRRSLEQELAALDAEEEAPAEEESAEESAEEEAPAEEEVAEEAAEEEVAEEASEEEAEPARAREEIEADLANVDGEIADLYAQLLPRAQEVIDAFNNGTDFDALIEQYGEDPGMNSEPAKSAGYAVAADSTYWDSAFTEGAMSIAEPGQISEPVFGGYGVHIIYYLGDVTPGAVPFEEVADYVTEQALSQATSEVYHQQVETWMTEAAPVYHLDRFH